MNLRKKERSGDEHYTPEDVVIKYLLPFVHDKNVYAPFSKESTVVQVLRRYTTVIDTPIKYGGDFFKAMEDEEFCTFLKKHKFVVCDNPPFSVAAKILRVLDSNDFDYFLLGSTLTALSTIKPIHFRAMYYILGTLSYQSGKQVNTCLISNTFDTIRLFPTSKKNDWRDLYVKNNSKFFSSAKIETLTKHGLVIPKNAIQGFANKLFFGGGISLDYNKLK